LPDANPAAHSRASEKSFPTQEKSMAAQAEPVGQDNTAQIAYWNDRAAVTWTALQDHLDGMFAPLTAIALDAAAPAPGERVIDIGCGCGATVLELARRIGPDQIPPGRVLGVDVSEPMTARARQRITAAGLTNADVLVSDASSHPFAPASADLLFSRFGVMFFADPAAAFANLRAAIRPGGRLVFACWRALEENSWFSVPVAAAGHLLPPSPPSEPDAPGPFAFADPDRVRRILAVAGWNHVTVTRQDVPIRVAGPGGITEAAEFATRVGALARGLAEAEPEVKARAAQLVAEALGPFDGPDGITLTGSIWLVSARN
jgi:SAM-dependent methyltransferase